MIHCAAGDLSRRALLRSRDGYHRVVEAGLLTMKTPALFLLSWVIGLLGYAGSLALIYRQPIGGGDLRFVLFWSFTAFAVCFILFYLPVQLTLRHLLRGVKPGWPFPVVAILMGVVPVMAILTLWDGRSRALVTPEALLFYCMFTVVGFVLGTEFVLINRSLTE
jgi:hypothetical protein